MRSVYLSLLLLPLSLASAATASVTPNFSGNWQLDGSKSKDSHDPISLTIKDDAGKINYERTLQSGGRRIVYRFSCTVGGSDCVFDENGHKATVSLWYDGPALMILKTKGPSHDETTERKLQLSPDGKILTVSFSNLTGNDKPDTLVFAKKE